MLAGLGTVVLVVTACSGGTSPAPETVTVPAAVRLFLSSTAARLGADTVEVWVCQVPQGTTDPTFNPSTLRLNLDPAALASLLNTYVGAYFGRLSDGRYQAVFVAGQVHVMSLIETPQQCVDAAFEGSSTTSNSVLAVATAEDGATVEGGFASPGSWCAASTFVLCSAKSTRRGGYVGASDFHPDWGPEPAVDLEEHEIGHTLGWPHSGLATDSHVSGIDVMSNSASPRDFDLARRDGPDTLGINRFAARWIPIADVAFGADRSTAPTTTVLAPSTGPSGTRLMVLPIDTERFLTVEYLPRTGFDDFLPRGGVTVTLIDQTAAVCGHAEGVPCVGFLRRQVTEVGAPPFYDLLTSSSPAWSGFGWKVQVQGLGDEATVQAVATG